MRTYEERKTERREAYAQKLTMHSVVCSACSGSGHYDHNGSPACGACDGTGRESVSRTPTAAVTLVPNWRDDLRLRNILVEARHGRTA